MFLGIIYGWIEKIIKGHRRKSEEMCSQFFFTHFLFWTTVTNYSFSNAIELVSFDVKIFIEVGDLFQLKMNKLNI